LTRRAFLGGAITSAGLQRFLLDRGQIGCLIFPIKRYPPDLLLGFEIEANNSQAAPSCSVDFRGGG
jgi:hypothetical protein